MKDMAREKKRFAGKGSYAYVSTRLRAKTAKLIQPQQYDKLLQMDIAEIAKFLEETEYKKEIDELALKESGEQLVMHALSLNQVRTFRHIMKISPPRSALLFSQYLREWDVFNIKTVLRALLSDENREEARALLVPLGDLDFQLLSSLLDKKDVSEALSALRATEYAPIFKGIDSLDSSSLIQIEVALDDLIFKEFSSLVKSVNEGRYFTDFMQLNSDVLNFKILLKLKKEEAPPAEVRKYFTSHGSLSVERLIAIYRLPFEGIFSYFRSLPLGPFVEPGISQFNEDGSLGLLEVGLDRYFIRHARTLLREHPLTIAPMLGYIASKKAEIKNIRTIVRGKHAHLDNSFIRKYLITV